ncbi:hypothetical protein [Streptomyces indiaensis]|uniref:Uncharacterized protein n=1 Tax=Streptomyces indiaensis TaxID=284033 RepID=A0ABP5QA84_9ACTN|nr:hypothetical protein [Streptomyces indiaensis]MCF1644580.1 hypothetical protein [Streptomyces indiaensis]
MRPFVIYTDTSLADADMAKTALWPFGASTDTVPRTPSCARAWAGT